MQVKFIKEFINQKLNIQYLSKFNSVINYAFQNIVTNMTLTDALKLSTGIIKVSANNFNSFRLDGEDKVINGGWFYVYNGKFINIDTKASILAEEVITEYFYSANGIATPLGDLFVPTEHSEPSTSTKKPIKAKKKNPSNTKTDIKSTGKDKP